MNGFIINGIDYQCNVSYNNRRYELKSEDGKVNVLTYPENHGHTFEDIVDVVVVNDVPCYVYQNDEGLYSFRPALEGTGIAIDAYCYDIDSWGTYGDFIKHSCPSCKNEWYMNVRQIPKGDMYETMCPKCGMLLKKKR